MRFANKMYGNMLLVFSPYVEKVEMGDIFEIVDEGAHKGRGLIVQVLDFLLPESADVSSFEFIDWELRETISKAAEAERDLPIVEDLARSFQVAVAQVIAEREARGGKVSEWKRWLPTPGSLVNPLSADEFKEILENLIRRSPKDMKLPIGCELASKLDLEISVDDYFKGHLAIFGMTRSGKSSFAVNLIASAVELDPPGRFILFDIREEYAPVLKKKYKDLVLIRKATEYFDSRLFSKERIAKYLGIGETKTGMAVAEEVHLRIQEGTLVNSGGNVVFDAIRDAVSGLSRIGSAAAKLVERADLQGKVATLAKYSQGSEDIIEDVRRNPIIVITHPERDITDLQRSAAIVLESILEHAFQTKGNEFACQLVFEEAHYYVPETNTPRFGDPSGTEVRSKLIEALSQAGGYNVGVTLICQRPAYVSKSALSQCNTLINFRVKTQGDKDQLASASEHMTPTLLGTISGLPNHQFVLTGLASPAHFPLIVVNDPKIFTAKAGKTASEVLTKMATETTPGTDSVLAGKIKTKREKSKRR